MQCNQFEGKTILITGGSSGIGQATAIAFANCGAQVIIADVQDARETVDRITAAGGKAVSLPCNVGSESEVQSVISFIVKEYGTLDFAFNNAGIEGQFTALQELSEEAFDRVISVNLKGVFFCMKHEIRQMLKQGHGSIVNCSSIAGLVGFPASSAYTASKHGVVGLTKTAALENAKLNIRINAVCPGVIHTPMIDRYIGENPAGKDQLGMSEPIGRMGRPEEIADAVIWLVSERASFVTGQAIPIDGGWVAQ